MKIAVSRSGVTSTALELREYTLGDWSARLSQPTVGAKDGSYFIRGSDLDAPVRGDAHLRSADWVILDGDSSYDADGEENPGAPPLGHTLAVLDTIDDAGLQYIAYTTHSCTATLWKYRVLLPMPRPITPAELRACVDWVIDRLNLARVPLTSPAENYKWSQPWFMPRVRDEAALGTFRHVASLDGPPDFPIAAAVAWRDREDARNRATLAAAAAVLPPKARVDPAIPGFGADDTRSLIDTFNAGFRKEQVYNLLLGHGYTLGYATSGKVRMLRPGSESKTPGCDIFAGKYGDAMVYSHHSAADPLANGKANSPFDVWCILEHGGRFKDAIGRLRVEAIRGTLPATRNAAQKGTISTQSAVSGNAAQKDTISAQVPEDPVTPPLLVQACDLQFSPARWLVEGLVPLGGMTALYGAPGSGKSFVALYIAAMTATQGICFGHAIENHGPVVYIAGEGAAGFHMRWHALRQHQPDMEPAGTRAPLFFVFQQMDFFTGAADVNRITDEVRMAALQPRLFVVDTLARVAVGADENDSGDIGKVIALIKGLQDRFPGSTVLAIHHTGKDTARGMRGSSALLGAADAVLKVTATGGVTVDKDKSGTLTVEKQKDGEDGAVLPFGLRKVQTGFASDCSLVVIPGQGMDTNPAAAKVQHLSKQNFAVYTAIREIVRQVEVGNRMEGIPQHVKAVPLAQCRDLVAIQWGEMKPASIVASFSRSITRLKDDRIVSTLGPYVWLEIE